MTLSNNAPYFCRDSEAVRQDLWRRVNHIQGMIGHLIDIETQYCSVEEYVARHGKCYSRTGLYMHEPPYEEVMTEGRCFDNAMALASWSNGHLRYCEGYAGYYGSHHAWCVDISGKVFDPTWNKELPEYRTPYLGVELDPDKAHAIFRMQDKSFTDNFVKLFRIYPGQLTPAMPYVFTARKNNKFMFNNCGPWLTPQYIDKLEKAHRAGRMKDDANT